MGKTGGKNRRQKPAEKSGRITQEKEREIVALLKTGESLRTGEVADALDLGLSRTRELLSSMVSKGLVVPEGTGRARVYRLPDEARE